MAPLFLSALCYSPFQKGGRADTGRHGHTHNLVQTEPQGMIQHPKIIQRLRDYSTRMLEMETKTIANVLFTCILPAG